MKTVLQFPDDGGRRNLRKLISCYRAECGPILAECLKRFTNLDLAKVVECDTLYKCRNPDGTLQIFKHQRRVGLDRLKKASRRLLIRSTELKNCRTFCDLLIRVTTVTANIHRFGELAQVTELRGAIR
jgi:hypothetical protein